MSATFEPYRWDEGLQLWRYALRCDCMEREMDAWDAGDQDARFSCRICTELQLNVHNQNAADLLSWLGIESSPAGDMIDANELAALCRRRLWDEPRNHDSELTPKQTAERIGATGHPRVITGGRPAGRLRELTRRLLVIAEYAAQQGYRVAWG